MMAKRTGKEKSPKGTADQAAPEAHGNQDTILLKRAISIEAIVEDLGLEESMVIKLRDELKRKPVYA